jgi:hypothetical protein
MQICVRLIVQRDTRCVLERAVSTLSARNRKWILKNLSSNFFQSFEFAVTDLQLALGCDSYPRDSRFKLLQRLARAHEATKDYPAAIEAYESLIGSLSEASLTSEQKSRLKGEAEQLLRSCRRQQTVHSFSSRGRFDEFVSAVIYGQS